MFCIGTYHIPLTPATKKINKQKKNSEDEVKYYGIRN